jgi:signal transduction histidine kinase
MRKVTGTPSAVTDGPVNILLVDDNPAKLLGYQAILEELGENLLVAPSARHALEILLATDVALLLVDVMMPELDGFEFMEMIRAHPRFEKTAVIFVSGVNLADVDRIRGYAMGAIDYISVPVVPEVLRAKVRVFVELYRKTRQLESLNRELEARIARRTAELEVEVRRKDEFLATLSHELRNPLAPILSCVRLLRMRTPDAATARHHDVLERQVLHLVRLVDDLLDVSRISRGTITLRSEPTDLAGLVRATVNAVLLRGTGHVIVAEIPERGPVASIDPVRMAQVVSNILDNATKFTPIGGKIVVSLLQEHDQAVLRVIDNGIGIGPQHLPRVFDLFVRVDQHGGGLGIGLALVRRLLQLQGGTVAANSGGEGLGTEIVVRIPCSTEPRIEVMPVELAAPRQPKPCRFLIVDDNAPAADTLAELLERSDYRAHATYSGEEAIRVGEQVEPDVVLLDLGMPVMDGFETAKRIRQTAWGGRTKIVALTGWGQHSDRQRTADAGFDGHLVKPVELEAVLKLLAAVES